jgi:hypothetical protein
MGDYAPPKIVGAHRDWLVERTAAFTLRGLVTELADCHSAFKFGLTQFGAGALWRAD